MSNPVLQIKDVEVCLGNSTVLEDISLSASKGELIAVIGPNGSGKTTLLRTISKVLKPERGAISIKGVALEHIGSKELAGIIAIVPQNTSVNFGFTALEVVLMGRNPHLKRFQSEGKRDVEIAKKMMELTKTWHLADRRIDEVSGGERQRIVIARALAQEPELLLLDEPTSNLDIAYQIEIMELLKQLACEGMAIIAAIHDLNLAAQYCSKLILLDHGRISTSGRAEEVLTAFNIKKVFHATVMVGRHPVSKLPYITHIPQIKPNSSALGKKIHVICGGGSGAPLMHSLITRGFEVSTGVVNVLDTDYEAAMQLGIEAAGEAPFSAITDEAFAANLELISRSDAILLASVPFGRANLKNLEACKKAIKMTKPVVILEENKAESRDFTGGEAARVLVELKDAGAVTAKNHVEAVEIIEKLIKGR